MIRWRRRLEGRSRGAVASGSGGRTLDGVRRVRGMGGDRQGREGTKGGGGEDGRGEVVGFHSLDDEGRRFSRFRLQRRLQVGIRSVLKEDLHQFTQAVLGGYMNGGFPLCVLVIGYGPVLHQKHGCGLAGL